MQRYERGILFFLQALFVALAFLSCTKDRMTVGPKESGAPNPDKGSIYIKIVTGGEDAASTRADSGDLAPDSGGEHDSGDLVNGTEAEHLIGMSGNYAIFFDEGEKFYALSELTLTNSNSFVHDEDGDDLNDHQREAVYGARIVAADEEQAQEFPSWCLVVLNGQPLEEQLTSLTIEDSVKDVEKILCSPAADEPLYSIGANGPGFGKNEDGLFVMSNASYVKDGKVITAVPIPDPADFIQETGIVDPDKILYIHVERMLAKFSLEIGQHDDEDQLIYLNRSASPIFLFDKLEKTGNDIAINTKTVPWRVRLTGWSMNALETESYLFKQIDDASVANYPSNWNDPENYRTYWSVDSHYEDDTYPWQYRDMRDRRKDIYPNFHHYSFLKDEDTDNNLLHNYSYEEMFGNGKNPDFDQRVIYTPENTYDYLSRQDQFSQDLDGREHLLAGTHLIIGAELQTYLNDAWDSRDLFRDRYGIYYGTAADCLLSLNHGFNRTLTSQMTMKYTYFNWDNPNDPENGTIRVAVPKAGSYNLYYGDEKMTFDSQYAEYDLAEALIKDGDGKRMPWPKDVELDIRTDEGAKLEIYAYKEIDHGENKRQEEYDPTNKLDFTKNDIMSLLFEWVGAVDHFSDGKMYYPAPVTNPFSSADGFYGTIRNNWYRYVLKGVKSIGTPVDDPGQPIVPLDVRTHDQLNISINILGWHTEERGVPIP